MPCENQNPLNPEVRFDFKYLMVNKSESMNMPNFGARFFCLKSPFPHQQIPEQIPTSQQNRIGLRQSETVSVCHMLFCGVFTSLVCYTLILYFFPSGVDAWMVMQ